MVVLGVANARFAADDLPQGHAHRAPAKPPSAKQLGAQLINRTGARARLAACDADVVDAHQARKLDRQLSARSRLDPARAFQAAPTAAYLDDPHRNRANQRRHGFLMLMVVAATGSHRFCPPG
jgi:hypothetical protein